MKKNIIEMTRQKVQDKHSLILLYFATFFVFTDFYTAQTITPIYILDVGGTEFYSGLQSTMFFLSAVLLRFYFGPLADARGNKIALLIGAAAFATAPFLFLINDSVWFIILIRIYQSIGLAAYFSSASSLASALAPKGKLGTYIGFYRLVIMSTLMFGPTLAMRVIEDYGYDLYHIIGVIIGMIALLLLFFIKEPESEVRTGLTALVPKYNMLYLLKEKKYRPIYLSIFVISISYALFLTFIGIYIEKQTGIENAGIAFTFFALGSIAANLLAGFLSDRFGRAVITFPCVVLLGFSLAILYFLPSFPSIIYAASLIAGFGYSGSIAVLISWIVDLAALNRRTTALALQDSSIDLGIALGSFVFGITGPLIGLGWTFAITGLLLLGFGISMIIGFSSKKAAISPSRS